MKWKRGMWGILRGLGCEIRTRIWQIMRIGADFFCFMKFAIPPSNSQKISLHLQHKLYTNEIKLKKRAFQQPTLIFFTHKN